MRKTFNLDDENLLAAQRLISMSLFSRFINWALKSHIKDFWQSIGKRGAQEGVDR